MRNWNIFFGSSSVATGDMPCLPAEKSRCEFPPSRYLNQSSAVRIHREQASNTAPPAVAQSNTPLRKNFPAHQSHPHFQFGNGCAEDFQAETINSRTNFRRRKSCSSIRSSASASQSYHSGGICPYISSSAVSAIRSTRAIQASNESIPRTASYTRFRAYRPRKGASGKFHSPALKQNPLSIIRAQL